MLNVLRKMKDLKQVETAGMMASMNNFTENYAKAMLASPRQEGLARPERQNVVAGLTPEQMARIKRELSASTKTIEPSGRRSATT